MEQKVPCDRSRSHRFQAGAASTGYLPEQYSARRAVAAVSRVCTVRAHCSGVGNPRGPNYLCLGPRRCRPLGGAPPPRVRLRLTDPDTSPLSAVMAGRLAAV